MLPTASPQELAKMAEQHLKSVDILELTRQIQAFRSLNLQQIKIGSPQQKEYFPEF